MDNKTTQTSVAGMVQASAAGLKKAAPVTLAVALVSASLLPVVQQADSPGLIMGMGILSGMGTEFMKSVGKDVTARMGKKKDEEIRKELTAQLFLTCLGDQFYTHTLQNMTHLLERLGVKLVFPPEQTCCGQPHFNNGFESQAREVARNFLHAFGQNDAPIVGPSGSCVGMVKHHYPELFPAGTPEHALATNIASRTFEFTEYLVNVLEITDVGATYPHKVTYHASCHYLREMGLKTEAKALLNAVKGLEFIPLDEEETCCGFGGAFTVTYPEVSRAMMENKVKNIIASGADAVITCEPGCLMNIAGGLHKAGSNIRAMHIIDLLSSR